MAEAQSPAPPSSQQRKISAPASSSSSSPRPKRPHQVPLHEIYALPAPIRTFPLPTFYPNNPLSILHLAWAWARQVISPPAPEPSAIWEGVWSPESGSVHVRDAKAMRALWEQGFYGKGNYSRSEPNWLKREKVRRGLLQVHVSEEMTASRREERIKMKWERAKAEQDAIRLTRLEEAKLANGQVTPPLESVWESSSFVAPVGPLELLSLPNSQPSQGLTASGAIESFTTSSSEDGGSPSKSDATSLTNGSNGEVKPLKRRKSVRFSPQVESATFQLSDPPSPGHVILNGKAANGSASRGRDTNLVDKDIVLPKPAVAGRRVKDVDMSSTTDVVPAEEEIENIEHLQLTPEEAFFLVFGLGALRVTDPVSGKPLDTLTLLTLFRQHSSFPSRAIAQLRPDDGFLINYAVYHHFRSLGWVPRPGLKFGMDWMLYARGPVFDHAQFGLILMPSFSHTWWKESGQIPAHDRTWQWLHGVVRVLAHVQKSLVLVYVDIPPLPLFNQALEVGPAEVFKLYKVREVMVKRWTSNRNR